LDHRCVGGPGSGGCQMAQRVACVIGRTLRTRCTERVVDGKRHLYPKCSRRARCCSGFFCCMG
jgi:hypothetical protein